MKPYISVSLSDLGSEYQRFGLTGTVIQSVEEGGVKLTMRQQSTLPEAS